MIDGFVTSIFGQRGAGKTTLMNHIINPASRAILFDYLHTRKTTADRMNFIHTRSLQDVRRLVIDNYHSGFRIWYQPPPDARAQQEALSKLSYILWDIQDQQWTSVGDVAFITFGIDEMSLPFPVTNLSDGLRGFNQVLTGGRHLGFNIVGASQRPAQVHTEFRSAAEVKYFLQLSEPRDLDVVAQTIGKPYREVPTVLQKLEYLRYSMGKIEKGNTTFL